MAGRTVLAIALSALVSACKKPAHLGSLSTTKLIAELRIGDDESGSAYEFVRIAGVAVDGDRVYVRDEASQFVRQFDQSGRFIRNIGRDGGGPGELRGLFAIGTLVDTLWTIDVALRRVSMFLPDGHFIRSWPLEQLGAVGSDRNDLFFSMPVALTNGGDMLGFGGTTGRAIADGRVTATPVYRLARTGAVLDTLTWLSIRNADMILRSSAATMYRSQPFADNPLLVCDGPNRRVVVIERFAPDRDELAAFRATALGERGDTLWTTPVPVEPVPITRAARDSVRDAIVRAVHPRFDAAEVDRALFLPEFAPPVTSAIAGADGSTWLRGVENGERVVYYVLDRNGRLASIASGSRSTRILWATDSTAWGEEVSDDVPTLVRFRIEESSRP